MAQSPEIIAKNQCLSELSHKIIVLKILMGCIKLCKCTNLYTTNVQSLEPKTFSRNLCLSVGGIKNDKS